MDPTLLAGLAAASGAVVTKLAELTLTYFKENRAAAKEDAASLTQYQTAHITKLQSQIDDLQNDVEGLHKAHADCRVENAQLRVEVRILKEELEIFKGTVSRFNINLGDEPVKPK